MKELKCTSVLIKDPKPNSVGNRKVKVKTGAF